MHPRVKQTLQTAGTGACQGKKLVHLRFHPDRGKNSLLLVARVAVHVLLQLTVTIGPAKL